MKLHAYFTQADDFFFLSFFLYLGADGTFDILKWADPELDLDDPNLIDSLDLMDDPKASSGEGEGEGEGEEKKKEGEKSEEKKPEG